MNAANKSRVVRAYLRYLASTSKPIVLGPFRSELGFEVLYWMPFLQWAQKKYGIKPDRCLALSRGGMGALYPAAKHVDLYALRSIDEVRLENLADAERRKIQKQTTVTVWDREIAREAVARTYGPRHRFHLLHPSWMYWLFEDFWEERVTMPHVATHTDFAPMPVPALPASLKLPEKFVAVKFYDRATLSMQPEIKPLIREMVAKLAQTMPVVVLAQPYCTDDHVDLPLSGPNILNLTPAPPDQHLLIQAGVLARAQAFVGTYGGVAQWALRYRKPSLSVYVKFGGTALAHRMLSHALSAHMSIPFELLELGAIKLWQATMVGQTLTQEQPQPASVA